MKPLSIHRLITCLLLGTVSVTVPLRAQNEPKATATIAPGGTNPAHDPEIMKQMMELSKTNENHKLLGDMAGTWSYVNMWMVPGGPAMESTGTAVRMAIMDGRYCIVDYTGQMKCPGPTAD